MDIFVLVTPMKPSGGDKELEEYADVHKRRHTVSSPSRPSHLSNHIKRHRLCGSSSKHESTTLTAPLREESGTRMGVAVRGLDNNLIDHGDTIKSVAKSVSNTALRLTRARDRRRNLHEGRVKVTQRRSNARLSAAALRAKYHIEWKIKKAHEIDERITKVKDRRITLDAKRRTAVRDRLSARDRTVAQRAARERRARELEVAQQKERERRARDRRALSEYERRAALLSALDYRVRRAQRNLEAAMRGRRERAGSEVRRAIAVGGRVRAARSIQRAVRKSFCFNGSVAEVPLEISQNEASQRLQGWRELRERVSSQRFLSEKVSLKTYKNGRKVTSANFEIDCSPTESLKVVLCLAGLPSDRNKHPPSFEVIRTKMTQTSTLQGAKCILHCISPIPQSTELNDRTLLSAFLISTHPNEVLGGNSGEELLAMRLTKASRNLVQSLSVLLDTLVHKSNSKTKMKTVRALRRVLTGIEAYAALFHLWKNADLDNLIDQMTVSTKQSWVSYLCSGEVLSYMDRLISEGGVFGIHRGRDDPLHSLRLRHDAQRLGSKSHIKRIRMSLNKIVGTDEGFRIVRRAKVAAHERIGDEDSVTILKQEVDELLNGDSKGSSKYHAFDSVSGVNLQNHLNFLSGMNANADDSFSPQEINTSKLPFDRSMVDELLSNEQLVHRIILTDPEDFEKLTIDGEDLLEDPSLGDFMSNWIELPEMMAKSGDRDLEVPLQQCMANDVKLTFFGRMVEEMKLGEYHPISNTLVELLDKMRQLIPDRTALHTYLSDEEVRGAKNASAVFNILLQLAEVLANHLEAPARAISTTEWMQATLQWKASPRNQAGDAAFLFGFHSKEQFLAASLAFLFLKVEICQIDISNFHLREVAPLIHEIGSKYESEKFLDKYGPINVASISSIKEKLPNTSSWVQKFTTCNEHLNEVGLVCFIERSMNMVKTRGFVDWLLFTKKSLPIPEILKMDSECIAHIRNQARFAVIGSTLVLHACNISGVGTATLENASVLKSIHTQKEKLDAVLRIKHKNKEDLAYNVAEAITGLARVLSRKNLSLCSNTALRNCVTAVLGGDDPVLKILDNRMKQFFRFICKWQPATNVTGERSARGGGLVTPISMRTGRSVLRSKGSTSTLPNSKLNEDASDSLKLACDAKREASKLGFTLFAKNLMEAGLMARNIINHACRLYGKSILEQLILDFINQGT